MLEAICQNTPILASDAGATCELFEENKQIGKIVKEPSLNLKNMLVSTASDKIIIKGNFKKYDWKKVFSKYESLFDSFMFKAKNVIVFDIDDTFVHKCFGQDENIIILKKVLEMHSHDCVLVINTGRGYNDILTSFNIKIPKKLIAITDNGYTIHIGNKIDLLWNNYVKKQIKISQETLEEFEDILLKSNITILKKIIYSNYYVKYIMKEENIMLGEVNNKMHGLSVIAAKQSIKLLSNAINKQNALKYIKGRYLANSRIIGIGNSGLDEMFINDCDIRYYINRKSSINDINEITIRNFDDIVLFIDLLKRQVTQ
jgi:hypothetical protein